MRKIAACDDSCPERSYLQPCKEISSGHRNAYSTLASYSSNGQNGQSKILPRNLTTKIPISPMTMVEIQVSYGQNGKPLI